MRLSNAVLWLASCWSIHQHVANSFAISPSSAFIAPKLKRSLCTFTTEGFFPLKSKKRKDDDVESKVTSNTEQNFSHRSPETSSSDAYLNMRHLLFAQQAQHEQADHMILSNILSFDPESYFVPLLMKGMTLSDPNHSNDTLNMFFASSRTAVPRAEAMNNETNSNQEIKSDLALPQQESNMLSQQLSKSLHFDSSQSGAVFQRRTRQQQTQTESPEKLQLQQNLSSLLQFARDDDPVPPRHKNMRTTDKITGRRKHRNLARPVESVESFDIADGIEKEMNDPCADIPDLYPDLCFVDNAMDDSADMIDVPDVYMKEYFPENGINKEQTKAVLDEAEPKEETTNPTKSKQQKVPIGKHGWKQDLSQLPGFDPHNPSPVMREAMRKHAIGQQEQQGHDAGRILRGASPDTHSSRRVWNPLEMPSGKRAQRKIPKGVATQNNFSFTIPTKLTRKNPSEGNDAKSTSRPFKQDLSVMPSRNPYESASLSRRKVPKAQPRKPTAKRDNRLKQDCRQDVSKRHTQQFSFSVSTRATKFDEIIAQRLLPAAATLKKDASTMPSLGPEDFSMSIAVGKAPKKPDKNKGNDKAGDEDEEVHHES